MQSQRVTRTSDQEAAALSAVATSASNSASLDGELPLSAECALWVMFKNCHCKGSGVPQGQRKETQFNMWDL